MRLKLVIASLFFVTATPAASADVFSVYGPFGVSCGKYTNEILSDLDGVILYRWWLIGFISGVNSEKSRALNTDGAALEAWVIKYCQENPLNSFTKAAIELDNELDKDQYKNKK